MIILKSIFDIQNFVVQFICLANFFKKYFAGRVVLARATTERKP